MAKITLTDKTVRELLDLEQAARLICAKYENLNKMDNFQSQALSEKFQNIVREKYDKIMMEIEKRVEEI